MLLSGEWEGAPGFCGHGELVVCVCVCAHTYLSSMLDLLTLFGRQWLGSFDCSKQLVSCDINGHFCVIYVNQVRSEVKSLIVS